MLKVFSYVSHGGLRLFGYYILNWDHWDSNICNNDKRRRRRWNLSPPDSSSHRSSEIGTSSKLITYQLLRHNTFAIFHSHNRQMAGKSSENSVVIHFFYIVLFTFLTAWLHHSTNAHTYSSSTRFQLKISAAATMRSVIKFRSIADSKRSKSLSWVLI